MLGGTSGQLTLGGREEMEQKSPQQSLITNTARENAMGIKSSDNRCMDAKPHPNLFHRSGASETSFSN